MTASLHWEFRLLHNFNPSALHKNRLQTRSNGRLDNLQNRGLNEAKICKAPKQALLSNIPANFSRPHLCIWSRHGFAQILKMDFFAHSLLISSPADTWISWQLLIWEQFSQICETRALLCPHFNRDLPFITRRPAENSACRFSKNGIQFPSLKQVGICWRNIWVFPCWGKLTG